MAAVYCDVPDLLMNGAAGMETASLIGGNTVLTAGIAAGATSLPIASTAGFPTSGSFPVWILDGFTSEKVQGSIAGSAMSVAAGTVAAHGTGVSISSAGPAGFLADVIVRASRAIDAYCRQGRDGDSERSLFSVMRTETANGPSIHAAWERDNTLIIRPWRWPVQSVTQVTVLWTIDMANSISFGSNAVAITDRTFIASLPSLPLVPATWLPVQRDAAFMATWSYAAGPCGSGLPGVPDDIREACYLLAADILGRRINPFGMSESVQGSIHRVMRFRGDNWTTALRERAYELLEQFAQRD